MGADLKLQEHFGRLALQVEDEVEDVDRLLGYLEETSPPAAAKEAIGDNLQLAYEQGKVGEADMVNLPPHYARFRIEPIRFAVENNLNFLQANIIKYTVRYDAKNGTEDLRKARRCMDMLIKFVEGDPDWWTKGH